MTVTYEPFAKRMFESINKTLMQKFPGFQDTPLYIKWGPLGVDENRERGGSPLSKHLTGEAIDVQLYPNTDDRKCVFASIAEYTLIKQDLGSEIAVEWGLNGHVHVAIIRYKSVHKRFAIQGGAVWTSYLGNNLVAIKKSIKKYGVNVNENIIPPGDVRDRLQQYTDDLTSAKDTKESGNVDLIMMRGERLTQELSKLNTSSFINEDLHKLFDKIDNPNMGKTNGW